MATDAQDRIDLPPGYALRRFETLDSTNTSAKDLAAGGAPERTVVLAGAQTGGRGRRGRAWVSSPGNLFLSILMRPVCSVAEAGQAGFAVSLAVSDFAAASAPGTNVFCKWPNDVLIGDRKVAGILIETSARGGGDLDWMIIGIGVNLASHPDDAEIPVRGLPATSLSAAGVNVSVEDAAAHVLAVFDTRWRQWRDTGFAPVRRAWIDRAWRLGEAVEVVAGEERVGGVIETLDSAGGLVLRLANGGQRVLGHGELLMAG